MYQKLTYKQKREYNLLLFYSLDDLKNEADKHKAKEAYNECNKYSRTIEIHYEDGSKTMLARVHFPYNPDVCSGKNVIFITFVVCLFFRISYVKR